MKVTVQVIEALKASRMLRLILCEALGFTEVWIDRVITSNKVNGPLTTMKAITVFRKELALIDSEILEELEPVTAK